MEHQTIIENLKTIFGLQPKIYSNIKLKQTEHTSIWIREFFDIAKQIERYVIFTIDDQWYTYFDLSDKSKLDQLHYVRYLEKISEKEPEKLIIKNCDPDRYIIFLHGISHIY